MYSSVEAKIFLLNRLRSDILSKVQQPDRIWTLVRDFSVEQLQACRMLIIAGEEPEMVAELVHRTPSKDILKTARRLRAAKKAGGKQGR